MRKESSDIEEINTGKWEKTKEEKIAEQRGQEKRGGEDKTREEKRGQRKTREEKRIE